jgi:hypothetical protein
MPAFSCDFLNYVNNEARVICLSCKTTMNVTPPSRSASSSMYIEEAPETPGPIRAKVKNLSNQVSELVRTNHAWEVSLALSYDHD